MSMANENLSLYVASYADAAAAEADFKSLKDAQAAEDFAVVGAVVASRDDAGEVTVDEHGAASPVAGSAVVGGAGGLVVGLFAPPLLLAAVVGAGIGAGIGELKKRHEEKKMGVDLEEYLPPGSSAVIVVVDDMYADRVDKALTKSTKKINKAVDSGDVRRSSPRHSRTPTRTSRTPSTPDTDRARLSAHALGRRRDSPKGPHHAAQPHPIPRAIARRSPCRPRPAGARCRRGARGGSRLR